MTTPNAWLVVIDVQPAFSHPDSPWFTPALAAVTEKIESLVPLFGERVVFTRFVPPSRPFGSWRSYYGKWPFALEDSSSWLWSAQARWAHRIVVASHTFSKWVPDLKAHLGVDPTIVLCGVSTDCCVLMTALAAVDDGVQVRVVEDACAAKSPEIHHRALALLAGRAPQLSITTVAAECAAR